MRKVKQILLIGILAGILSSFINHSRSFKQKQLLNSKVKEAFEFYEVDLQTKLLLKGIKKSQLELYIRAFKMEQIVEVWAKNKFDGTFQMVTNYKFCNSIGRLGPKRKQGDRQIPEGYYTLSQFNPNSNYHLSLKVSYPNASDSILGYRNNLGGQIYFHGGCATLGCIPITDELISEMYVLAVLARDAGQEDIPIHIFPARMNKSNQFTLAKSDYPSKTKKFWTNMQYGYEYFEKFGKLPSVSVNNSGAYVYGKN